MTGADARPPAAWRKRLAAAMARRALVFAVALLAAPHALPAAGAETVPALSDDRGRSIRLDHPARRIIALSPNITELVFAAGAGDKLAAVSSHSDYPRAARSLPVVGDAVRLDLEQIVALRPDLVIAWRSGNAAADIDQLERLGLTVFVTEAPRLADIPRLLRVIGRLAGTSGQAEAAAHAYQAQLRRIRQHYRGRPRVSVFALIWHQPLMTVNRAHSISDIIDLCGGVNLFAAAPALTPVISVESLLAADPQAIIASVPLESIESSLRDLRHSARLDAVGRDHWFFVQPDLLHRQSPRTLQAAETVCEQLESVRSERRNAGKRQEGGASPQ